MAEGLLRFLYGKRYEAYRVGTQPTHINPHAIKVLAEMGIDISAQYLKKII